MNRDIVVIAAVVISVVISFALVWMASRDMEH